MKRVEGQNKEQRASSRHHPTPHGHGQTEARVASQAGRYMLRGARQGGRWMPRGEARGKEAEAGARWAGWLMQGQVRKATGCRARGGKQVDARAQGAGSVWYLEAVGDDRLLAGPAAREVQVQRVHQPRPEVHRVALQQQSGTMAALESTSPRQHSPAQHGAAQHSTAQHRTALQGNARHATAGAMQALVSRRAGQPTGWMERLRAAASASHTATEGSRVQPLSALCGTSDMIKRTVDLGDQRCKRQLCD